MSMPTDTAGAGAAPLLEREGQLSALNEALASAAAGRGKVVFVGGEAGVGKTALLQRFCEEHRKSVRLLWGACDSLFTPRPLGPFLDIAESTGGDPQELVDRGAKPHELASALMRELRRRVPAIVVVEDVQNADEATLDVLTLLARRIGTIPALVLASYRDDELDRAHPLRVVLGELATGESTRRVAVEPLSQAAVAALAEAAEVDAGELYSRTGGNPFFVTEILAGAAVEIPETVRDAVLARAARLGAEARSLLDAMAIAPAHVELWLLEALAGDAVDRLRAGPRGQERRP
jgi:predicted ATPase